MDIDHSRSIVEPAPERGVDWRARPLAELVEYIITAHHTFTREALASAEHLLERVCDAHIRRHPELHRVHALFESLRDDLGPHMLKEERVLFRYIVALDESARFGAPPPHPAFRTAAAPIHMMNLEHEGVGVMLRALRDATSGYVVPADGCASYGALFETLKALEEDLHLHIHLESDILFPRALELEGRR